MTTTGRLWLSELVMTYCRPPTVILKNAVTPGFAPWKSDWVWVWMWSKFISHTLAGKSMLCLSKPLLNVLNICCWNNLFFNINVSLLSMHHKCSTFNSSHVQIPRGESESANKPDELDIVLNISWTVTFLLRRKYGYAFQLLKVKIHF